MARPLFLSPFQPRQRWVPRCPDPLQLKRQAPVPVMRKWPSLLEAALRIAWKWNVDSWNSKPRQLVERRVKERWKVQVSDPLRKETMREVCVCIDIRELWGNVTRECPRVGFLGTVLKFRKTKKIRSRLLTSSRKREIRHFHVVVVQWRQRIVPKSMMHVQICFCVQ